MVGDTVLVGVGSSVGVGVGVSGACPCAGVGVLTTDVGRTSVGVGSEACCLVSCCWLI